MPFRPPMLSRCIVMTSRDERRNNEERYETYTCFGTFDSVGGGGKRRRLRSRLLEEHDDHLSERAGGARSFPGPDGLKCEVHGGLERPEGGRRLLENSGQARRLSAGLH